jgi:microcompartment protein CcmK/EutM
LVLDPRHWVAVDFQIGTGTDEVVVVSVHHSGVARCGVVR